MKRNVIGMDLTEKTLTRAVIYNGHVIDVEVHDVALPNGKSAKRDLVYHPGAVAVCAITPDEHVVFVEQFRKPLEHRLLEIPAGKLEPGEDKYKAALRELSEETGYTAKDMISLGEIYTSPGFANEKITLYLALDVVKGEAHPDEDEFVNIVELPLSEVKEKLKQHALEDAKTIVALQHFLLNYNDYN